MIDPGIAAMQPSFPASTEKKHEWREEGRKAIKRACKEAGPHFIPVFYYEHPKCMFFAAPLPEIPGFLRPTFISKLFVSPDIIVPSRATHCLRCCTFLWFYHCLYPKKGKIFMYYFLYLLIAGKRNIREKRKRD